jgi:hypothetical protein
VINIKSVKNKNNIFFPKKTIKKKNGKTRKILQKMKIRRKMVINRPNVK